MHCKYTKPQYICSCVGQLFQGFEKNILRIRNCLTDDAAATLINAQITDRLDNFNANFNAYPFIHKLQTVHNNAAMLLTRTSMRYSNHHIAPILKRLHWLPVRFSELKLHYRFHSSVSTSNTVIEVS